MHHHGTQPFVLHVQPVAQTGGLHVLEQHASHHRLALEAPQLLPEARRGTGLLHGVHEVGNDGTRNRPVGPSQGIGRVAHDRRPAAQPARERHQLPRVLARKPRGQRAAAERLVGFGHLDRRTYERHDGRVAQRGATALADLLPHGFSPPSSDFRKLSKSIASTSTNNF